MTEKNALYQGTLDLLIFQSVSAQALHGWGISRWLETKSGGHLNVPQGSLYPALHRLESQGLLRSKWMKTPEGRKAKYYSLTQKGKKALSVTRSRWEDYSAAVSKIMSASA